MSIRSAVSVVTLALLGVVLYSARESLAQAWQLLGQVNIWVLLIAVPTVIVSYIATGEMIFSYLRQKRLIGDVHPLNLMRISMELNFVNHVLPSGGASGVAYLNWRIGRFGVAMARATMAQAVRYVAGFMAAVIMLVFALLFVTIDGTVNRWLILMSAMLVIIMIVVTFGLHLVASNKSRATKIASLITRWGNGVVRKLTLGKKSNALNYNRVNKFLLEIHDDYKELTKEKRILKQPLLWGMLYVVMDVVVFWAAFQSLGTYVNPASILIAYHLASLAGFAIVTPGGIGAYEAIMVAIIVMSGVSQPDAIAGILLGRAIILLVTVGVGYIFYQHAILKYGKAPKLDSNL